MKKKDISFIQKSEEIKKRSKDSNINTRNWIIEVFLL